MTKSKLIKCTDCAHEISRNAKTCPNCGAKNKKKPDSLIVAILKIFICLFFAAVLLSMCEKKNTTSFSQTPTQHNDDAQQTSNNTQEESWRYHRNEDEMNGRKTFFAVIESINTVNFDFPYSGAQRGKLTLRTHPRYGKDIILSISSGQFLCRYDGCSVLVRFDESEPVRFQASEPSDNRSTSLFINAYSNFVGRMMKAKKVRIEASFYQEGNRIFEFDVKDFDANRYLQKH